MLTQSPNELLIIPDTVKPTRRSIYEKLYFFLKDNDNLEQYRNNPDALLDLIEKNAPSSVDVSMRKARNEKLVAKFKQYTPANIVDFGIEADCGYSALYLTRAFAQIHPDFNLFACYDRHNITSQERQMVNYLIELSGLEQIKTFWSPDTVETFLSKLGQQHRIEWILINHQDPVSDVRNLKMMESVSLVQPGVTVLKLNDFDNHPGMDDYILSTPMVKRVYSDRSLPPGYIGRWNLVYRQEDEEDTSEPVFYVCEEILDT